MKQITGNKLLVKALKEVPGSNSSVRVRSSPIRL